jgi:hypothetical protein
MKVLIGDTGLIGKTLIDSIEFDLAFNSKTIKSIESHNLNGSDLYLACLPATKWKVNKDPILDFINMSSIINAISKYEYSRIILISTIDVYSDSPIGVDEDFTPSFASTNYGSNRYVFELLVKSLKSESTEIFRLPALFGKHIKKNVLFDLLTDNNIDMINYNSAFQWYNLSRLASDLQSQPGVSKVVNLFTEPLDTALLLELFSVSPTRVNQSNAPIRYDWRTKYSTTGYRQSKEEVFSEIVNFVNAYGN